MPPFYADKTAKQDQPCRKRRPINVPACRTRSPQCAVADAPRRAWMTRRVAAAEVANIIGAMVTDSVVPPFDAPQTGSTPNPGPAAAQYGTSLDRSAFAPFRTPANVTGK